MIIEGIWISPAMFQEVAQITGTHRTTVARWYQRKQLPAAIARLLDVILNGNLENIDVQWQGFKICRQSGELVTDQGYRFTAGDIRAWQMRRHQLSLLERENRELRRALAERRLQQLDRPVVSL